MPTINITGIGVISSLGIGREAFWEGCLEARSGIKQITRFDTEPYLLMILLLRRTPDDCKARQSSDPLTLVYLFVINLHISRIISPNPKRIPQPMILPRIRSR